MTWSRAGMSRGAFHRKFKRAYGQSPRQWSDTQKQPEAFV
ncbi:helix-turn-helix transcriptional regulator [Planktotalea sp.]